jgi:hypothetical protein
VLGLELLAIEASTEDAEAGEGEELAGGTTSAYPLGFSASPGDQRWESGAGGGEL